MHSQQVDQIEVTVEDKTLDHYETADFQPSQATVFID